MIVLALTLTAWALLHKYTRKPQKRRKMPVYAAPMMPSAADLERQRKAQERAQRDAERAEKQAEKERAAEEKRMIQKAQAVEDVAFLENRLECLYEQIEDANAQLYAARRNCRYDADMNSHGAVVADKIVNKHIAERDKLMRKVMTLENQIHSAEQKLNKARRIAAA